MSLRDIMRCCSKCRATCNNEFKQIVNLKNSGLVIYAYNNNAENTTRHTNYKNNASIVLHNVGRREVKKFDYVVELCQYKTKCYQCQNIIQRIRNLLDDINIIRKNEVLAICDHCKRSNYKKKCSRCEYLLEKFIASSVKDHESLRDEYRAWWCTVKNTLLTILDVKKTCPHRVCFIENSDMELKKLIDLLKAPSPSIRPCIETFPTKAVDTSVPMDDETKQILLGVLDDLSLDNVHSQLSKNSSESDNRTCMCRYFDDKKKENIQTRVSLEMPIVSETMKEKESASHYESSGAIKKIPDLIMPGKKNVAERIGSSQEGQNLDDKEISRSRKKKKETNKDKDTHRSLSDLNEEVGPSGTGKVKKKQFKDDKRRVDPEYQLMLQLIKEHQKEMKPKDRTKSAIRILKQMPVIEDLPQLPVRQRRSIQETSESSRTTLVCTPRVSLPRVMISGTIEVPLERNLKTKPTSLEPILFRKKFDFNLPFDLQQKNLKDSVRLRDKSVYKADQPDKGIVKYALSNKDFIERGWTKLPTTKVMRRINLYRMEPTNPQFDWFKRHNLKREVLYDSGEILAVINENGCSGKWFYKNGSVALDFRKSINNNQRYIIYGYSVTDEMRIKTNKNQITILACFDFLGNGIVYDDTGKPRLKYNQSEGIIIDEKIAPPSKWKWHTLNDPPVLQNVYVDNNVRNKEVLNQLNMNIDYTEFYTEDLPKTRDEEMLTIELENFIKEKATKIMQEFKPFKIRMKAVKINDYFSLRVIDQANIYILYRCGRTKLKLNIGMRLKSSEIIDTYMAEVSEVSTPYDSSQPDTESLCDIQNVLNDMKESHKSQT